jgi:peptidyl-prolyl cis-trans isomerase SurA
MIRSLHIGINPRPVLRSALVVLACAIVAASCGSSSGTASSTSSGSAVPAPSSPDVWAVVDGREIKRDEAERVYRASLQEAAAAPTPEESLNTMLGIVEELITQDLLVARASAAGLEPTPAEIDAAFAERKRGMSDQEFQKRMTERSLTEEDVKRAIRRELAAQKLFEREVTGKVVVSDQDVSSFFERNKGRFNITETQYRLAQIVVTPVRDPQLRNRLNDDAATPAAAQQKMQMLLTKLRGGADFAQLAMDYSEDPNTLAQGGDLGFVPVSALQQSSPALQQVVAKTQPGNVTSAMAGNVHMLVMVVSREDPGQRTLDSPAVRDGIRDLLRETRTQTLRSAFVAAARDDARIVNHLARAVVSAQGAPPAPLLAAPTVK